MSFDHHPRWYAKLRAGQLRSIFIAHQEAIKSDFFDHPAWSTIVPVEQQNDEFRVSLWNAIRNEVEKNGSSRSDSNAKSWLNVYRVAQQGLGTLRIPVVASWFMMSLFKRLAPSDQYYSFTFYEICRYHTMVYTTRHHLGLMWNTIAERAYQLNSIDNQPSNNDKKSQVDEVNTQLSQCIKNWSQRVGDTGAVVSFEFIRLVAETLVAKHQLPVERWERLFACFEYETDRQLVDFGYNPLSMMLTAFVDASRYLEFVGDYYRGGWADRLNKLGCDIGSWVGVALILEAGRCVDLKQEIFSGLNLRKWRENFSSDISLIESEINLCIQNLGEKWEQTQLDLIQKAVRPFKDNLALVDIEKDLPSQADQLVTEILEDEVEPSQLKSGIQLLSHVLLSHLECRILSENSYLYEAMMEERLSLMVDFERFGFFWFKRQRLVTLCQRLSGIPRADLLAEILDVVLKRLASSKRLAKLGSTEHTQAIPTVNELELVSGLLLSRHGERKAGAIFRCWFASCLRPFESKMTSALVTGEGMKHLECVSSAHMRSWLDKQIPGTTAGVHLLAQSNMISVKAMAGPGESHDAKQVANSHQRIVLEQLLRQIGKSLIDRKTNIENSVLSWWEGIGANVWATGFSPDLLSNHLHTALQNMLAVDESAMINQLIEKSILDRTPKTVETSIQNKRVWFAPLIKCSPGHQLILTQCQHVLGITPSILNLVNRQQSIENSYTEKILKTFKYFLDLYANFPDEESAWHQAIRSCPEIFNLKQASLSEQWLRLSCELPMSLSKPDRLFLTEKLLRGRVCFIQWQIARVISHQTKKIITDTVNMLTLALPVLGAEEMPDKQHLALDLGRVCRSLCYAYSHHSGCGAAINGARYVLQALIPVRPYNKQQWLVIWSHLEKQIRNHIPTSFYQPLRLMLKPYSDVTNKVDQIKPVAELLFKSDESVFDDALQLEQQWRDLTGGLLLASLVDPDGPVKPAGLINRMLSLCPLIKDLDSRIWASRLNSITELVQPVMPKELLGQFKWCCNVFVGSLINIDSVNRFANVRSFDIATVCLAETTGCARNWKSDLYSRWALEPSSFPDAMDIHVAKCNGWELPSGKQLHKLDSWLDSELTIGPKKSLLQSLGVSKTTPEQPAYVRNAVRDVTGLHILPPQSSRELSLTLFDVYCVFTDSIPEIKAEESNSDFELGQQSAAEAMACLCMTQSLVEGSVNQNKRMNAKEREKMRASCIRDLGTLLREIGFGALGLSYTNKVESWYRLTTLPHLHPATKTEAPSQLSFLCKQIKVQFGKTKHARTFSEINSIRKLIES